MKFPTLQTSRLDLIEIREEHLWETQLPKKYWKSRFYPGRNTLGMNVLE